MYQSYRRVELRNNTLCCLYYALTMSMAGLIIMMLVVNHGHLSIHEPVVARFIQTVEPHDYTQFAQCGESNRACRIWDWLESVHTTADTAFIATSVDDVLQKRLCARSARECTKYKRIWSTVNSSSYKLAGAGRLEIQVEHTLVAPRFKGRGVPTEGVLTRGGHICRYAMKHMFFPPPEWSLETFANASDTIAVHRLLRAAGHALTDDIAYHGMHLDVRIFYSNLWRETFYWTQPWTWDWKSWIVPGDIRYMYCVGATPDSKTTKMIYTVGEEVDHLKKREAVGVYAKDETRVVRTLHGLQINFRAEGKIGEVSAFAAIQFLASALSLLSLPWVVVELVLSVLPLVAPRRWLPSWYYGAFVTECAKEQDQATKEGVVHKKQD